MPSDIHELSAAQLRILCWIRDTPDKRAEEIVDAAGTWWTSMLNLSSRGLVTGQRSRPSLAGAGRPLLVRRNSRVSLTDTGRALLDEAQRRGLLNAADSPPSPR